MHYISISWKLIFAVVPPADLCGGWVAFYVSLLFIGMITAIVAAFAELFGCMVGLKDEITAISFVALGTSLPDTSPRGRRPCSATTRTPPSETSPGRTA